jgi:2-polyprenyl-3-methyl-5-hydroxy-6-metoxy-1,4-benzoquinol methylase
MKPEFYADNQRYAEGLRKNDPRRFQSLPRLGKYLRALAEGVATEGAILDVGCGVGQVVRALREQGFAARGIDVSHANVAEAGDADCTVYDGRTIPFSDATFASVGACNVLEHVEEPIRFLDEMARVLKSEGQMVVSSPNFLRVLGWRDYHPHMSGLRQKMRNLRTLLHHVQLYGQEHGFIHFEAMEPVFREEPQPDDDATVATNGVDLRQYFGTRGFTNVRVSCVDRPVPRFLEFVLDATPLRYLMLNAFVTARKR